MSQDLEMDYPWVWKSLNYESPNSCFGSMVRGPTDRLPFVSHSPPNKKVTRVDHSTPTQIIDSF
ncbi:hypothetical protein N7519_009852 [Penicillium mononematosum]|uniref:uncharacterized protein n=1 Tax=Penicillium mononematosum TaxID=268346 RepID=UPI002547BBBD|nr:uncharacterized protein N7519_009852 [Penicillium mononematosum]KAJ6179391.1 hypothetical protein N7519_009852 [Penicillium mononematosum]